MLLVGWVTACGEDRRADGTRLLGKGVHMRALERAEREQYRQRINRLKRKIREAEAAVEPASPTSPADLDSLGERLGAQVGGTIGRPGAEPLVAGSLQSGPAWSTIKVPITLEVIDEAGGTAGLSSARQSEIAAALTASDNEAAAALFEGLVSRNGSIAAASEAVTQTMREAGDPETVVSTQGRGTFSSYGQTEWTLPAQHAFMSGLVGGCVSTEDARSLVLGQMRSVTSDTWGLGSVGAPALWKGGWGPGLDGRYLVRQMGAVEISGVQHVVTLAVIPDSGDFGAAQSDATAVAQWLVDHAPNAEAGAGRCQGAIRKAAASET